MKKIIAWIMIAISIITLGYYNISMILINKADVKFEEISGDRNILKEDEIKFLITRHFVTYEQTISKKGSNVEKTYAETVDLNISKKEFEKNKSFYRGVGGLEFPVYEDDQYKIMSSSVSQLDYSSKDVNNEINISYIEKSKGTKVHRIKLTSPVKVHGINPMVMKNVNGKLTYIYCGNLFGEGSKLVFVITTIDLKSGTVQKQKVIYTEKIFDTMDFSFGMPFITTGENLYISCFKYVKKGVVNVNIYAMDLENYQMRKVNIDGENIEYERVREINGEILLTSINNGKLIINKFNKDTENIVKYNEVNLPKDYIQKSEDGVTNELKKNIQMEIVGIKDHKIYLSIDLYDETESKYMEVLDSNNGSSLYKFRVDGYARSIIMK